MRVSTIALVAPLAIAWQALAAPPPEAATTLHEAVASAWALMPQRRGFEARQNVAAAHDVAGRAFFPNAPTLQASHINDKLAGSNENYITTQVELGTPIWLPGEGTATRATAAADSEAIAAESEAAHLALAAQVLGLAAEATRAVRAARLAERQLVTAQSLAADVDRRFRVGESAQSDALAADAQAESARITLAEAQAQSGTAMASLAAVTGQEAIPCLALPAAAAVASRRASSDVLAGHPRIVAAERAVAAAEASARLTRIENRDSPEISLQGINEKQPGTRWDTRFGVLFRLPFATEARNAPRRAAAEEVVTQAMIQLDLARREVLAAIRGIGAILAGAERAVAPATRAADALERRRGQIERAWRLGEMSLVEVVRADELAFNAELARDKAAIDRDVASERLQLAMGILP